MGLDDIAKGALLLIGVGLVSKRFGAGVGLGELGTGVSTLVAAPAVGLGTGLTGIAGGIRDIAATFGDIGRGLGAIFEAIPKLPVIPGAPSEPGQTTIEEPQNGLYYLTLPYLTTDPGGDAKTLLAGGGGNVPNGRVMTLGTDIGPITGTYSQIFQFYATRGFTEQQIHSLVDPHFTSMNGGNLV